MAKIPFIKIETAEHKQWITRLHKAINENRLGMTDAHGEAVWQDVKQCILSQHREPTPSEVFMIGYELGREYEQTNNEPQWKKNWEGQQG